MRPRPAGSRQWPRRDDRPADVERLIAEHAANAVAHILEDGTPQPGGDPAEMRAHALEQAERLGRVAQQLIDAASQAQAGQLRLRELAAGPMPVALVDGEEAA